MWVPKHGSMGHSQRYHSDREVSSPGQLTGKLLWFHWNSTGKPCTGFSLIRHLADGPIGKMAPSLENLTGRQFLSPDEPSQVMLPR